MTVRTVIVDDEAPARSELSWVLRQLSYIEVVGEAENANKALALILAESPDLVFLDVQMPGRNGIELSRELARLPKRPHVIFTTAYDQYAIEAFEINALDYLLKPYDDARVLMAANRAYRAILGDDKQKRTGSIERLAVRKDEKVFLLPFEEIALAYALGRDVLVCAHGVSYRSDCSLQELEQKLSQHNFFRCHRSYLVNLDRVKEVSLWFNGGYALRLEDFPEPVIVSRKQAKEFRERVGI